MKRYEVLVILNLMGREEGLDEVIGKLTGTVEECGGSVLRVDKLDKRTFARQSVKNISGGFYVKFQIQLASASLPELQEKFGSTSEVLRVLTTTFQGEPTPELSAA